jgi:hypothetical protein
MQNNIFFVVCEIKKKIIYTPIVNFLPQLKLHPVIVISKPRMKNIYTIDFSPFKDSVLQLLFGQNITAEVRVRKLDVDYNAFDEIIYDKFAAATLNLTEEQSIKETRKVIHNIHKKDIKNKIKKMKHDYCTDMNLYENNCQHFCSSVFDSI